MKRFIRLVFTLTLALGILAATGPSLISAAKILQTPTNSESSKTGTVRIKLRGCADGIDPNTAPQDCDIPLDAPLYSSLAARDDPQSYYQSINDGIPRDQDGTYVIEGVPASVSVTLRQFWPTEHNHFMYVGLNESADVGWDGHITLYQNEVRDVSIYYWNGREGLIEPGTNDVTVKLRGCADGVDPRQDPEECEIPLDAPDAAKFGTSDGTGRAVKLADMPRRDDGGYLLDEIGPYVEVMLLDLHGVEHNSHYIEGADLTTDTGANFFVERAETREVTVYYFNEGTSTPPAQETGSIRIKVRGCPDGVDPNVDTLECTIPLDIPETARIGHRHGLMDVTVADHPREYDGTYLIEDVPPEGYTLTGLESEAHDSFLVAGLTEGTLVGDVIDVTPGETTNIQIFYYNVGAPADDTATLLITFRACPEGIDPSFDATECTIPLDAPPAATAQWYVGESNFVVNHERLTDGTYVIDGISDSAPNQPGRAGPSYAVGPASYQGTAHQRFMFVGVDSVDQHGIGVVNHQPRETREVTVYDYND